MTNAQGGWGSKHDASQTCQMKPMKPDINPSFVAILAADIVEDNGEADEVGL
jgi:hypothetical protein